MYHKGGVSYIYLYYGIHYLFNVVRRQIGCSKCSPDKIHFSSHWPQDDINKNRER
ncbi:MAG: hypothetical protein DRJ05_09585 [Bacteroidetes bacterium]|nr:MAG: hypothetical protein DRI89_10945 [Bacteroidota bacterium]RLD57519.1 MAG: hypothetical protein DRJ05_09585 [Bacteroidota bacterium]